MSALDLVLRIRQTGADGAAREVRGLGKAANEAAALLKRAFAGFSGAWLAKEFVQTSDEITRLNGRVRLATTSAQEYRTAQEAIYKISQANATGLSETATLYARLADPVRKLGGSTREATAITEAMATALRISGATGAEASSAILQFSQAMASGVLRGEEFNAVNEAAPRVMTALEAALGKTRGELRQMAEQGELTADVVANALMSQLGALQSEAQQMPDTVGMAWQRMKNDVALFVGDVNSASGATAGLAEVIGGLSGLLGTVRAAFVELAGGAATAGSELDGTKVVLAALGYTMERVVVLTAEAASALKILGLSLGAVGAAVASGDFKAVPHIFRELTADIERNREETNRFTGAVVGATDRMLAQRDALKSGAVSASEHKAEMARLTRQTDEAGGGFKHLEVATKASSDAGKKATDEAKKQRAEYDKLVGSLKEKIARNEQEVRLLDDDMTPAQRRALGVVGELKTATIGLTGEQQTKLGKLEDELKLLKDDLTPAQREALSVLGGIETGTTKLTTAQKAEVAQLLLLNIELEKEAAKQKAAREEVEKAETARQAAIGKVKEHTTEIEKETAEVEKANIALRDGESALKAIEAAKESEAIASADRQAVIAAEVIGDEALAQAFRDQATALRRLKVLKEENVQLQAAEQARTAWEETTKSIEGGLTDALFRAFEGGKSFFEAFKETLINAFKNMVLQPTIRAILAPVAGSLGSVFGGSASAAGGAAGGSGGGFMDLLSGLGSVGSALSGAGSLFGASAGMTMSGGFGAAIEAAGAALGNGSILGGLSIGAGAIAPFAAGAAAIYGIYQALRKERTPHSGGGAMSTALGGSAATWQEVTGLGPRNVDRSADAEKGMVALSQSVAQLIQPLADLAGAGQVRVGTAFADDKSADDAWGALRILAGRRTLADWGGTRMFADGEKGYADFVAGIAASTRSAIASLRLPQWARDVASELKDGATLDDITKIVQKIKDMGDAQKAFVDLSRFGGIFSQMAGASIGAQKALVDLMGGIEALQASAQSFVQGYYSQDEQMAILARGVRDTLREAGVDTANLRTRADYRAVLETINPTTENMGQVAALLKNATAFGTIADYLAKGNAEGTLGNLTLNQLAKQAPTPDVLEAIQALNNNDGMVGVQTAVADSGTKIVTAIGTLESSVVTALTAVATATAATARQLTAWDNGGALSTVVETP